MSIKRLLKIKWLPLALWPLGALAEFAAFFFLFRGEGDVPIEAVLYRAVGGSFIACGLIAWQRRPDNPTGALMALTGFLFFAEPLLAELDSSVAFTLAQVTANWWTITFAVLILGFPNGTIRSRLDALIIGGFVLVQVVLQVIWLFFLEFPPGPSNVLLISADADVADAIDTFQRWFGIMVVVASLVAVSVARWLRAPALLRRLLLPMLAGALAFFVIAVQVIYLLVTDEPSLGSTRATQTASAVALVVVPLAFVLGLLRAQFARAGMADLVVALRNAPDSKQVGELIAKALRDQSLVLAYWLPGLDTYVDSEGQPVPLPAPGSGRAATLVERDGEPVAALVHDAALAYEPELLEIVCATADVALEQERLQAELRAHAEELMGSRARIVEAGDLARKRIERDLHDGAQQRLVALMIALRLAEGRIQDDPAAAGKLVASAREELAQSLAELRELAHGIHPAALAFGLGPALKSLAARSPLPVTLSLEAEERLPERVETAAYFVASEALANVGKYANASHVAIRLSRHNGVAVIAIEDDGVGGADSTGGSGLRGLADRVESVGGRLEVVSPPGSGTTLIAEMPCESASPAAS